IVELARLAEDDRPRAEDQDALEVSSFWHCLPSSWRSGRTDIQCRGDRDSPPDALESRTPVDRCVPAPEENRQTMRREWGEGWRAPSQGPQRTHGSGW